MTFENLAFQATWREYQERVLRELDGHIEDDHLHVVAAPGSGKTILGLEVMRRIGKPSVILAPTIAIRNQWIDRLVSLFLPEDQPIPSWISKDIRRPGFLTVTTYQALHAALSNRSMEISEDKFHNPANTPAGEVAHVIAGLRSNNVRCLVFDEAHHLRKEWWKALTELKNGLDNPIVISLTATPPYDVDYREWKKYQELCGPVDAEISVPELVKRGDLCPHQDYVYFSLPTKMELEKLKQFKDDVAGFLQSLSLNQAFTNAFSAHPWVNDTKNHVEDILNEPKFFSATIIFLNWTGIKPPDYALNILGVKHSSVPNLTSEWLEILLTGMLYTHVDYFLDYKDTLDVVRKDLKRIGAIERRRVTIDNTREIRKLLASSLSKLNSIIDITRAEATSLGQQLRMVILTDYIRKADLPSRKNDTRPVNKIGVVPIFESLRRENISGVKLGVLTGSLIIIPRDAKPLLEKIAQTLKIDTTIIRYNDVAHDDCFVHIQIKGQQQQRIVQLITEVFNAGGISVLVGTQALLGEGWDAPSINTLVLASHVGSYMLSNQMRGRAIRTNPAVPDKAANIWHLAAVDSQSIRDQLPLLLADRGKSDIPRAEFDVFDDIKQNLGDDIKMLRRRFRAFEGLSFDNPVVIKNGFKRLCLADIKWNDSGIKQQNEQTVQHATNRDRLAGLWQRALDGTSPKPKMRERMEANFVPRALAFADTLKYMLINVVMSGLMWAAQLSRQSHQGETFFTTLIIAFGVAFIFTFVKLIKVVYLLVRNGSLENSIKQVGQCVVESLRQTGAIKTESKHLRIESTKDKLGIAYCRLEGATSTEKHHFLEAMLEVLGATDNPRYLLVRKSYLARILRVDYHPVPALLGQNKEHAEFFTKRWNRHVGSAKLVFTRTIEGRAILLRARTSSLASAFQKKTDRVTIWE